MKKVLLISMLLAGCSKHTYTWQSMEAGPTGVKCHNYSSGMCGVNLLNCENPPGVTFLNGSMHCLTNGALIEIPNEK